MGIHVNTIPDAEKEHGIIDFNIVTNFNTIT